MSETGTRLDRPGRIIEKVRASAVRAAKSCAPCALLRGWTGIRIDGTPVQRAQGIFVATTALALWLECLERQQPISPGDLDAFKDRALALKSETDDFAVQQAVDAVIRAAGGLEVSAPTILKGQWHAIAAAWETQRDPNAAGAIVRASNGVSGTCLNDPAIPA